MNIVLAGTLQVGWLCAALFSISAAFRARGWSVTTALTGAVVGVGTFAMLIFWIAWWTKFGPMSWATLRYAMLGIVTAAAGWHSFSGRWRDEIAIPLIATFASSLLILAWAFVGHPGDPLAVASMRWSHQLPGDNRIPLDFAMAIEAGHVPTPLHADWLSSDRPPLQTALYLLFPGSLFFGRATAYQASSVGLQLTCLIGVWAVARAMGISLLLSSATLVAVTFTPMVLVNSIFVWPKLLGATFILLALALITENQRTALMGYLMGACLALAMLSHGTSLFAVMGLAVAALATRSIHWRPAAAMAACALVLYLPWVAYQRYVDPPGTRLVKWAFAGSHNIDDRSVSQTIADRYASTPLSEVIDARITNAKFLFAGMYDSMRKTWSAIRHGKLGNWQSASILLAEIRAHQFFGCVAGMGLLGFAFFLIPFGLATSHLRAISAAIFVTIAVWVLTMFSPYATAIHQGSYFPELAVLILAILFVASWSGKAALALIAGHSALTIFQYLF
jgi:hypothetical protein